MRLSGKIALVTGAASGIGMAIARLFLKEGARVIAVDLNPAVALLAGSELLAVDTSLHCIVADLSEQGGALKAAQKASDLFGRLDILVHAAGITKRGNVVTLEVDDWQRIINTDLNSAFYLSRACLPLMVEHGGAITFISSQLALVGAENTVAYAAAKGGLISFTRAMAVDHAPRIRVNCICPGAVRTPMLLNDLGSMGEHAISDWKARHPMGTFGEPEDIAYAALYLSSEEARFATGTILVIDGGYTSW